MCFNQLILVNEYFLGKAWLDLYYPRIQESLGYSKEKDDYSRDLLSTILSTKAIKGPEILSEIFTNQTVFMLGAGPSLESDLLGLSSILKNGHTPVVAADGAADALYEHGIAPSAIVSDLDSCSLQNLSRNSREGYLFAHAHGDNVDLVRKILPDLGPRVFGTTQVNSVNRVLNFGGLTDGDRACYIISSYGPKVVIIAGMDFGAEEGEYSKSKYESKLSPLRPTKLAWGKRSLEFLIEQRNDIEFYNVTKFGHEIKGAKRLQYSEVTLTAH